jgi:hypothetical protein
MIRFFFISLAVTSLFACHSTRKIKSTISTLDTARIVVVDSTRADSAAYIDQIYEGVMSNRIDSFATFSARIKVDYWDKDGHGPELTMVARIRKDSLIWISVNATVFSYEAFRIVVTPDSVKVLNKKDKLLTLRSISYLQEVARLPFDFYTLQDLIVGNPIYFSENIVSFKNGPGTVTVLSKGDYFKNLLTLSNPDFLVQNSKLDDLDEHRNRTCFMAYSDYEIRDRLHFPLKRKLSISEKSKLDLAMEFKQYNFNEALTFPFSIPSGYRLN